jgi:hypothetical protein
LEVFVSGKWRPQRVWARKPRLLTLKELEEVSRVIVLNTGGGPPVTAVTFD